MFSDDLAKGLVIQAASVLQRSTPGGVYASLALAVAVFAVWQGLATRMFLAGSCSENVTHKVDSNLRIQTQFVRPYQTLSPVLHFIPLSGFSVVMDVTQ